MIGMEHKRITLLSGHYGSGKTNIAVNLAFELKKTCDRVAIADIDIVNPYFRTKDSEKELAAAGIRLICSEYANSNLDIPALPDELYSIIDDKELTAVVDIGGDDRGALALGRFAPGIVEEGDYEMLMVINCYRPLTRTAEAILEIRREIETAGGITFTGLVNNSNLGAETEPEDVLRSVAFAREVSEKTGLPIRMTTIDQRLFKALSGKIEHLFPLRLQDKIN